jgi:rRNA maturation RNase YbeY
MRRELKKKPPGNAQPIEKGQSSTITLSNRQRSRKISQQLLKEITMATLGELRIGHVDLGIILMTVAKMATLNQQFLGHEGPTDVITFDYRDSKPSIKRSREQLTGEIFICVAQAEKQAKEFRTSWQDEIARYVIHGLLHLVGYDDLKAPARRKMKREEERLLQKISLRFALSKL